MQNIINTLKGTALGVAQYLTPVLKESQFRETGRLTPEEFVAAGDHLVYHYPSWQWASGDVDKVKSYLPKDKQYLTTKKVPCSHRCKDIDCHSELSKGVLATDEDGWVDTKPFYAIEESDLVSPQVNDVASAVQSGISSDGNVLSENTNKDDDDEAVDMDDFLDDNLLEDEQEATTKTETFNNEILQIRTYDLYITYDKYYQTPRFWLQGYNENQKLLTLEEMYEDIYQDYVNKTITMEQHPHLPTVQMASIHPCKHADLMKKLIDIVAESGHEIGVHVYLVIFLKFVQSVIPTIEYDFTQSVTF